jgi:hypothetical protein
MNAFRIIRAAFIWLTALMTLVTGLPHFRCQCPNGSVKPFCFGYGCSASACCCGNACESVPAGVRHGRAPAPGRNRRAACCCTNVTRSSDSARSGGVPHVQSRGCVKSLAQHQNLVPSRPGATASDGGAFIAVLASCHSGSTPTLARIGLAHLSAPPPSDLVILHQRFII